MPAPVDDAHVTTTGSSPTGAEGHVPAPQPTNPPPTQYRSQSDRAVRLTTQLVRSSKLEIVELKLHQFQAISQYAGIPQGVYSPWLSVPGLRQHRILWELMNHYL